MEELDIGRILDNYSHTNYRDDIDTWNRWLSWMCDVYEWSNIRQCGGMQQAFQKAMEDNKYFFDAMFTYVQVAVKGIKFHGAYDALGNIYETCYQSSHKASSTGQFFTPRTVCDFMSKIINPKEYQTDRIITHCDPCCGSGRLLIAEWKNADKYSKNFFAAGDIDITSVNMCAMNVLINGMVGYVEQRNALSMEWSFGYIVNGCKVPFANNFCCLQKYTDESKFKYAQDRLLELMKDWDVAKYGPDKDFQPCAPSEEYVSENDQAKEVEPIQENAVEPVVKKRAEPIQLELF